MQMFGLGNDIWCVQRGIIGFVRGWLAHFPKEPAFRVGCMSTDVKGSLRRIQSFDDTKTRLIDGTFWLFRIFESDTDLITELRSFVLLQVIDRLVEVVFEQIEKDIVVVFGHARVVHNQCTISNQSISCLCNANSSLNKI